jgi:hypothetical protein
MKKTFIFGVLVTIIANLLVTPVYASALPVPVTSAQSPVTELFEKIVSERTDSNTEMVSLDEFIGSVTENKNDALAGIYIPGQLALPVLQQPSGKISYVSTRNDVVTQFSLATQYGSIGLLAHNFLSGKKFFDLHEGMEISLVYGNGKIDHYRITMTESYQALSPESVYSDFMNMADEKGAKLTSAQLFQHIYSAHNRLVLQTCIAGEKSMSEGRLFIIAEKIS